MAQQRAHQEEYEITASNGQVYRVTGTAKQAKDLGDWIEQRIAAGDPQLSGNVTRPHNAQIVQGRPEVEGVQYKDAGPDGQRQVDRGGFMAGLDSLIRGGARGVTGNFMDEIAAGLDAVVPLDRLSGMPVKSIWDGSSFSDAYNHNVNLQRQIDEADDAQHPYLSGTGKVGGAVAQTLLGARALGALAPRAATALEAASTAAPLRTATAVGAVGGGAQGLLAGAGEGESTAQRAKNAKLGGFTGAMMGGALAPVAASLAPAVGRYASVLFGRAPEKEATRQLVQALQRDGFDVTSPSGVQALRQELSNYLGKPVSLADIGSATRARAGVGLRAPSAAQGQAIDTVMQRQAGQGARLASDIRSTVAPRTDVHALDDALVAQREEAAIPLRDQALFTEGQGFGNVGDPRQALVAPTGRVEPEAADAGLRRMLGMEVPEATPQYVPVPRAGTDVALTRQSRIHEDPQLQQLARLPFAQRALGAATKLAQEEVNLRSVLGQPIDHLPDVSAAGANLDMRTLDYLKRFLDKEVSSLGRGAATDTFKAAEYGQVRDLRNALRERMRDQVPEYGQYLDAYRGSSEMIDALREGRQFRQLDPEHITAGQGGRSQAAQELYRVGAARDLLDDVNAARDGANPASRILNSNEARDQLAATGVSPDDLARLNRSVGIERQLNLLPAELAGSQTAARAAAAMDADAGVAAQLPFNPGSPLGWIGAIGRGVLNHASTARNARVNEALLPRMLESNPAAIERTIQELEASGRATEAETLRRAVRTRLLTGTLGNLIGGASAVNEGN